MLRKGKKIKFTHIGLVCDKKLQLNLDCYRNVFSDTYYESFSIIQEFNKNNRISVLVLVRNIFFLKRYFKKEA